MGAITLIIYQLLIRFNIPLMITKLIIVIILILYSIYIGFVPSALRAIAMAILLIPKTYKNSSLDILSFIFIMMVIINPKFIYNIGFQFSFLISTFLLLAQPYLKNLTLSKTIITITCLSQFSSVIISAYHFNQFQWIGFLSNIFIIVLYSFLQLFFSLFSVISNIIIIC
ncbi:ComEC/Rec2 family competence protein [Staphylococcus saccharolyticus]|nr:ComEC/Rec2 family competence protein [Staphylococcus saccharolyticus]